MKPQNNKQKKKIIKKLNEQYGIKNLPYLTLQFGNEKLRLYSGSLSKEELSNLDNTLNIENIGLYFAKYENEDIRLTIDGIQLLKNEITKNILELNDKEAINWLKGFDIELKADKSWKILKYKDEFIGCGKSTGERITNFMPKERRIKN
jgi:NOL1/NOP2/fmu family ribosome biogenesis protein